MSTDPPRTSSRPRQKSQRALEHEDTKRYLEQQVQQQQQQLDSPAKHPKPRAKSKKTKHRKHDSYCVCKQDKPGPMIECSVCDNWFHFECIHLAEDDAEKIQKYVCPACTLSNPDQHTTYIYDIASFPSPSPPPGLELDPAGAGIGMQDKSRSRDGNGGEDKDDTGDEDEDEYDEDDDGDKLEIMSSTQSDSASISVSGEDSDLDAGSNASGPSRKRARPRPRPRPRAPSSRPQPQARPRLPSKSKSKSTNVPGGRGRDEKSPHPSTSSTHHPRSKPETKHTGSLPPIRQYVLSKLTLLVHTLFSSPPSTHPLTEEESARYAADVERAMFQAFKDIHPSHTSTHTTSTSGSTGTGGSTSESAGTRYKTQFNLLTSSLTKNKHLLRPSLLQSILSLSLPPGSLALLSASDLASAAQLEEMERAKQAVLESTVKTREEREMEREMLGGGGGGMIAGRDGLERLEDTREKEMWEVRKEEERERERSRSAQYAREHELRGEHQQPRERRESEMERDSKQQGPDMSQVVHPQSYTPTPSNAARLLH
ncbi:hypothetical protein I307_00488 [Cryptococcus deuterogattii 99/473]|uniref:Transcription factor BYE1 n=1 Tax=Cryptococcus deuterogattii Ram5 TaxID=1296110 RepID=A0A0D0V5B8_9TREE|nr:hypothetical protein I309_02939 [Cryptococcus deuterogattii LA55]KIR41844.1 hypothetical protein I313_02004 [Cryptococcus deuterogattii Ram5]KIR73331.1 hypothetical protein I310_02997 [Cryptococcus deuterogattii CA1014]KIR91666.1 hypothetical protein I304_04490 [Cryptococcus deuterogattii CBS 10090]KIR99087.1 hypothetical protein L804_03709 [Cryptococcus deuterogattii 2001/935-1]KIY60042.1 hypothetical protein I307_00488 [Cryptococcus deuterogattii 99/473]